MAASWSPSSIRWWSFTMGAFPLLPGTPVVAIFEKEGMLWLLCATA